MTKNPSLPDPFEWHRSYQKPCRACGLSKFIGPHGSKWEHRRVRPGEREAGIFAIRLARLRGGALHTGHGIRFLNEAGNPIDLRPKENVGNRTDLRGKRGEHGPTARTKDRIGRATTLLANGKTRPEVAAILKVTVEALFDYQFHYPGLWQGSYDAAMVAVRDTVRQLAGTDAMPEDMQAFLLAGVRADRWSRARGEQLFERGDAMTLPRFFEEHYLPLRPQSVGSVKKDRIILRRWAIVTADPPLVEISKTTLALFRDTLLRARGLKVVKLMSPNTVAGYLERIQTFLDKAGPSGPRNRDAMEFIPKVPWVKPPSTVRRAVRIVSEEVLNNFYLGCIAAERPRSPDYKPAAFWRALVVFLYNTGLRRGTTFKIRMRWVDWQKRCIIIPPEITKTGMEQCVPLNPVVIEHLQRIRGEREYLFDYGRSVDRYFYTTFHRLQDACGIPRAEHFGLHQLRKTCATVLWEHNPQAAQFALGHTSLETTASFYVRGQAMLQRAVEQMPQPAAFCGKDGAI